MALESTDGYHNNWCIQLSTQDLTVPVMCSLRVCKVVLMHNRLTSHQ